MFNRLSEEVKSKVKLLALMGPSESANFEIRFSNLLGKAYEKSDFATLPEIEKIHNLVVLCFYGEEDKINLCNKLAPLGIKSIPIKSGHRFGHNFQSIVDAILDEIKNKK